MSSFVKLRQYSFDHGAVIYFRHRPDQALLECNSVNPD